MSVPMNERMYTVWVRVLVREDSPADAIAAVSEALKDGHFIDEKFDKVEGPQQLDFNAELADAELSP